MKVTPELAQRILKAECERREADCLAEVQAVLDKHRCDLIGRPDFTPDGRVVVRVQVMARR